MLQYCSLPLPSNPFTLVSLELANLTYTMPLGQLLQCACADIAVLLTAEAGSKCSGNTQPEGNSFPSDVELNDAETVRQVPKYFYEYNFSRTKFTV
jgi:hypothetical protein